MITPNKTVCIIFLTLILPVLFWSSGCTSKTETSYPKTGKLKLLFSHEIDQNPIVFDTMRYTNTAGNRYLINEIQYFISDVTLHGIDGSTWLLDAWEDIHYVDTDLPDTHSYGLIDEIIPNDYASISFTFGINETKNQTLMFVNPPESFMFWPENLGGGYHYMKLNGKWLNPSDVVIPFDFHLGIGQEYYAYPDSIISFTQNYFNVELPQSFITITADQTTTVEIAMQVENWFRSPNTYDHNTWGGDIMQNQDAMILGVENGWDVFKIKNISKK